MTPKSKSSGIPLPLLLLAGLFVAVSSVVIVYKPDRPVATIVPGSSSGPAFVVQIIRPRMGLPLGGILPPQLFGLDPHLVFESGGSGATFEIADRKRFEFSADNWDLVIALDGDGRVTTETRIVCEFVFEEQFRKVRCSPDDPAVGTFSTVALPGSDELSGSFDIELAHCEDAETGKSLGWPPQPLILHGSFDRLPLNAERR